MTIKIKHHHQPLRNRAHIMNSLINNSNTSEHTPGPWAISKHATPEHSPQFGIYSDEAANDHCIVKEANAEADARLIAAAPDLLAALKDTLSLVVGQFHDGTNTTCVQRTIDSARTAIAKAGGADHP